MLSRCLLCSIFASAVGWLPPSPLGLQTRAAAWFHGTAPRSRLSASVSESSRASVSACFDGGCDTHDGAAVASTAAAADIDIPATSDNDAQSPALLARPTVWSEFSALAAETGAINLGQGFPNWAPPDFVVAAAHAALSGGFHQYTRTAGHPRLVELLAGRYGSHLGRSIDAYAEVAVTVGASQALYVTMSTILSPGDEVVLLEPFFDLYVGQIELAGGVPRYVPLVPRRGAWELDIAALRAAMGPKTRAIVVNTPHNPTGKVFTAAELAAIAEVVREHPRALVVSDEVYKYLVYDEAHTAGQQGGLGEVADLAPLPPLDGAVADAAAGIAEEGIGATYTTPVWPPAPPAGGQTTPPNGAREAVGAAAGAEPPPRLLNGAAAAAAAAARAAAAAAAASAAAAARHVHFATLPGMWERTLTISSAGKTFGVTGWQVGWVVGPRRLVAPIQAVLPYMQFCASTPMQEAMATALMEADRPYLGHASYYDWLRGRYAEKRQRLATALRAAGIEPMEGAGGGFFLVGDVGNIDVPRRYLDEGTPAMPEMTRDWAFCRWMALEHGLVAIPTSAFFSQGSRAVGAGARYVRFCFAKTDETLEAAAKALAGLREAALVGAGDAK